VTVAVYSLLDPLARYLFPVLDGIPQRRAVAFQTGNPGYVERYLYPYQFESQHAYGWKASDLQVETVKGRVTLGIVLVEVAA
jgi:hypothetical protein